MIISGRNSIYMDKGALHLKRNIIIKYTLNTVYKNSKILHFMQ